mgnify:CR=1 FL=1
MKKNLLLGLCLVFIAIFFSGCADKKLEYETKQSAYQVIDDQGTIIKLQGKPQRIMTTHFHLDNLLLGVVPQDRIVAMSKTMDDPMISYAASSDIDKPQKLTEITLENVVALKPDLIISRSTIGAEKIQSYRDLGIPVYVSEMPIDVVEVKAKIAGIAEAVGEAEHGKILNAKIDKELAAIEKAAHEKVRYSTSCVLVSKMNHNYGGKGCFFDDLCNKAQIRNAVADMGIMNGELISKEIMVKADPDFFLLSEGWELKNGNADTYRQEFYEDPALQHLKAVQAKHVLYLKDKYIYASNQNCVWAVKKLANLVYGNIFAPEEEVFLKGY